MEEMMFKRRIRIEHGLAALGIGGALVAALAMWWPEEPRDLPPPAEAASPRPAPVDTRSEAPAPQPVIETAVEVEAKRPLVALEHQEEGVEHFALAQTKIEEGDLAAAFDALRKHLYTEGPSPEVLLQIGRVGGQLQEWAIAEQALLDAGALDPTSAEIALERGRVLFEAGDHAGAREAARQAIRLDRDHAGAWNLAGRVAMAESHWERAELAFRQAVQLDPTDPMLHNNLGLLYVLQRRGKDATDSLETSVQLYGDDVPFFVFNNLGLARELAGKFEEARDAFEQALVANPEYARARVNLRRVSTTIANAEQAQLDRSRTAELEEQDAPEEAPAELIPDGLELGDDDQGPESGDELSEDSEIH
jgi:Tfp pilus assembly protein PilF